MTSEAPFIIFPPGYASGRTLEAGQPDDQVFSWESQARQHPQKGEPGFGHRRVKVTSPAWDRDDIWIEIITYRDESGDLLGILDYFPNGVPDHEEPGAFAVFVHPAHRREGIGTAVVGEALLRGVGAGRILNVEASVPSESGAAWTNTNLAHFRETGESPYIPAAQRLRAKHGQSVE